MIPKGLKVGDTFVDNGFTFEVTKVVGENYESKRTGIKTPSPVLITEPTVKSEEVKEDAPDYNSLPYATLKKLCAERGLDATGKKDDLVARLEG